MAKLGSLVNRFKKAIDEEEKRLQDEEAARKKSEAAAAKAAAAEKKRRASALKARKELLDEITELAKAIGLTVKSTKEGLNLSYKDRSLTLETADADRLGILYDGATPGDNMSLESNGEWTITRVVDGFGANQTLEEGLEDLLVDALHLPHPDGKAPAAPAAPPKPAKKPAKRAAAKKKGKSDDTGNPARSLRKEKKQTPGGALRDLSNPWD